MNFLQSAVCGIGISAVFSFFCGCAEPDSVTQAPEKTGTATGIFHQKTDDIGEFDPAAGREVSDGKIDEDRLATPLIGGLAAYGPLVEQTSKLQIQHAINLFHAANDRYPKDHAEFMQQIIKANRIQLPVLPAEAEYQYDVENHELVVVKAVAEE